MNTTLSQIRDRSPCSEGWVKLLTYLGKTKADDEPLTIATILDSNGLDDALWCLCAVKGKDREMRLYAVWCVRQVQNLLTEKYVLAVLDVAEAFAEGKATKEDLAAARRSWDELGEAGGVWDANAIALAAARSTMRDAAYTTAWAAAAEASEAAARAAARAARAARYAAGASAADAAESAAKGVAWAVWYASEASCAEAAMKGTP